MFGYVNSNPNEMSESDRACYQRYYCGLCQELGRVSGAKGQMLLNYDLTFLAILLSGLYEPETSTESFRCLIHPINKKQGYENEAIRYAAAMDIILSYHNLLDNYEDEGSIGSKLAANAFKKDYDKIKDLFPRQVEAVEKYIKDLSMAEKSKEKNLDLVSNYTGEMLATLFDWREDMWSNDLRSLGFYLGKFIYTIDAYDDLKKDLKKGNYNPLIYMKEDNPKDFECFVKMNLTSLMAECAKSFERLPIVEHADILRNIIYSGVWTKYEYLQLKDKKNKDTNKETNS